MFAGRSLLAALLVAAAPLPAQHGPAAAIRTQLTPAEWRADLAHLAAELPRLHPNAYYRTPKSTFDSTVADLHRRIPSLASADIILGFIRIVALVRDGHTSLNPRISNLGFHEFPVEFYRFGDGLFIRRAGPGFTELAGSRVVKFGTLEPDQALQRVGAVVSRENEYFLGFLGPQLLSVAEVIHGLGLVAEMGKLPLVLEMNGTRREVTLSISGPARQTVFGPDVPAPGWTDMTAGKAVPLYRRQPERLYFFEWLPESRTMYLVYRSAVSSDADPLPGFWNRLFHAVDSLRPQNLVVDARDNLGGNNNNNLPLVLGIIRRPWLDQPGRFFVVTGRKTYSAGQNLVNDLERLTQATFAGEPTGSPIHMYGDPAPLVLPNSRITVMISRLYHQTANPRDNRVALLPMVAAELTSAHYRDGRDPVLEAVIRRSGEGSLAQRVRRLVASGDTARAELLVREAGHDPEYRYSSPEQMINQLGYTLLRAGIRDSAVRVFAINTRVFPESANTWDSLGDGLEGASRRAEAIAAFRKALALDSGMTSSREGLRRLGAE